MRRGPRTGTRTATGERWTEPGVPGGAGCGAAVLGSGGLYAARPPAGEDVAAGTTVRGVRNCLHHP
ncbi:hypothetical protein ACFWCB_12755 [Streptomyces sp. NPDC060048]|uniref:hypothetical protein n=1 Tax=unclassified Streptomyces TaxID=2593676 RepID=UPI0036C1107B